MTDKEAFIQEAKYVKEAYEVMCKIYEGMSIDDLRVMYKYREGWEQELIKAIGTKKKADEDNRN